MYGNKRVCVVIQGVITWCCQREMFVTGQYRVIQSIVAWWLLQVM